MQKIQKYICKLLHGLRGGGLELYYCDYLANETRGVSSEDERRGSGWDSRNFVIPLGLCRVRAGAKGVRCGLSRPQTLPSLSADCCSSLRNHMRAAGCLSAHQGHSRGAPPASLSISAVSTPFPKGGRLRIAGGAK